MYRNSIRGSTQSDDSLTALAAACAIGAMAACAFLRNPPSFPMMMAAVCWMLLARTEHVSVSPATATRSVCAGTRKTV